MQTIYHCELCGNKSHNKEEIEECEAQGVFKNTGFEPGTMYEYHHNGFVGIFAIPEGYPKHYTANQHLGLLAFWACRDKGLPGDSLDHLCGGDLLDSDSEGFKAWIKHHYITPRYKKHSTFKRMVAFLKSRGITPRYYDKKGKLHIVRGK